MRRAVDAVSEALVIEALFTAMFAAALSFEPSAATGAFDSCGEQAERAQIVAIANEHAARDRRESREVAVMVFTSSKVSNRQFPIHAQENREGRSSTKFPSDDITASERERASFGVHLADEARLTYMRLRG